MSDTGNRRRAQLKLDVALMRELGVERWGEIALGSAPVTVTKRETTKEEDEERIEAEVQKRMDIMFAATTTRPRVTGMRRIK